MTGAAEPFELTEPCPATMIPSGQHVVLPAGEWVQVAQRLGGTVTLRTSSGFLARVDDPTLLGLAAEEEGTGSGSGSGEFSLDRVHDALRAVYDPEIPVDIVELGLVYRCEEIVEGGRRRIEIDMSMTAPGCGMGDVLRDDATRAVAAVPGVDEVDVSLVWDPPWTMYRMSEAARLQLGLL